MYASILGLFAICRMLSINIVTLEQIDIAFTSHKVRENILTINLFSSLYYTMLPADESSSAIVLLCYWIPSAFIYICVNFA